MSMASDRINILSENYRHIDNFCYIDDINDTLFKYHFFFIEELVQLHAGC